MTDEKEAEKSEFSEKVRSNIASSLEAAREQKKRELFRRRVELAKTGLMQYERRNVAEAVKSFHSYLHILEEWKRVPEGGLKPSHFDQKEELPELLLISGIYWDLSKIYDRTKTDKRLKEFNHYLDKFVLFSRGMPFESLSRETLRKYIAVGKPMHKSSFDSAYKRLGGGKCFVATAVEPYLSSQEMDSLRKFRDEFLRNRSWGRAFIKSYYQWGPSLASLVLKGPIWFQRLVARKIRIILKLIRF